MGHENLTAAEIVALLSQNLSTSILPGISGEVNNALSPETLELVCTYEQIGDAGARQQLRALANQMARVSGTKRGAKSLAE